MKKILMLLSNPFRPDVRVYKEAISLIENGYDVTIIAWDRGKRYPKIEVVDKIKVERVQIHSAYSNFLSFILKLPLFWLAVFTTMVKKDFDVVHCHDFDTLPIGFLIAKFRRKKLIYDAHEWYSRMISETTPKFILRMVDIAEKYFVKKTDLVITVSDPFAKIFREYGAKKIIVTMNCPFIEHPSSKSIDEIRSKINPSNKQVILYIGVLEPERNLEEIADAVLKKKDFLFVIGGFGSLENTLKGKSDGENVVFMGQVNPKDVPAYIFAADILVITYDPSNPNNKLNVPNKLFEAMAAGKPVVVTKNSEAGMIVRKKRCGIAVDYFNPDEVISAFYSLKNDKKIYAELSVNGIKASKEMYNWGIMEKRLIDAYADMM
ncbi:MAG: glycosyltransferase family 4 protein [Thermoplasmatales archaeon]|nr:glycosyltransferase family 4 protein [Thermoplasmatales archaeon]